MRNSNAFLNRNDVRAWLLALALGGLSLSAGAAAVNRSNIGSAGLVQTGRTTSLTAGAPPVNSGGSTIPMSPTVGGWTQAGNYGVPPVASPSGTGATLMADGKVYIRYPGGQSLDGVNFPVRANYTIPWPTVAAGAAAVVCTIGTGGACGVASVAAAAMPYVMDWMQRAGVSRNPTTGALESAPDTSGYQQSDGYSYYTSYDSSPPKLFNTPDAACKGMAASWSSANGVLLTNVRAEGLTCFAATPSGNQNYPWTAVNRGDPSSCPQGYWITPNGCVSPSNLPKVAIGLGKLVDMLGNVTPDSRVIGEVLERGGTLEVPDPTVTGPGSIQGPETVVQNPDGSKEVSRTTYNFQTSGNTITNTTINTTTNYYNSSNVQTGTRTETKTPVEEQASGTNQQNEQPTTCDKYPDVVGCKKIDFDTPDGEIPRDNKTITYQEENLFGGGSCPADKSMGFVTTGQTLKVVDWQSMCSSLLPIRAVVMALALFGAFLILMPGKGES